MISHFYYQCLDYDKTDVKELTKESSVIKKLSMKIFFIKRESEDVSVYSTHNGIASMIETGSST